MLNLLNWDKPIRVNGVVYPTATDALEALDTFAGEITIEFNWKDTLHTPVLPALDPAAPVGPQASMDGKLYHIHVRQYMCKKGDGDFKFHEEKNNGIPMPWRTMVGEKLEETRGLVKMRLHGFMNRMTDPVNSCRVCGRALTNPVSYITGIGPECSGRGHIPRANTPDAILAQWEPLRQKVETEVTWEGWIIKSAILEEWEVIKDADGNYVEKEDEQC